MIVGLLRASLESFRLQLEVSADELAVEDTGQEGELSGLRENEMDVAAGERVLSAALRLADGALTSATPPVDAAGLLTKVARDGVDLPAGPADHRIKECGRPDCALLFLDESPAGARRWCSMETCGARSKMAAYRQRLDPEALP